MLLLLLAKDLRRTLRNPWPWILNLSLPIALTALIGLAFGGGGKDKGETMRIKLAIVDEDRSFLSSSLRSALGQGKGAEHLDPIFVDRAEALRVLRLNQISAILVIPTNFTSNYLLGESGLKLEVIKNPAQAFLPAMVEELAAAAVTGLNAISRNLNSEFPKLRAAFTNEWGMEQLSEAMKVVGERLKAARGYLDPPLISYEKTVTEKKEAKPKSMIVGIFGFILPGMASAFLLFIADQSMRDFHREVRMKTLDRQRTVGGGAGMFIAGKIIFTAISVVIAAAILFTGGSLIFGVDWGHPALLGLACVGYAIFAAGLMAALSALAPSERRIDALNSILIFSIAFLGGSYMPSDNFPRFLKENVTVWMPNYWLIETARALQDGRAEYMAPLLVVAKLAAVGAALGVIAAVVIERRLTAGARQ